jgi:hypothetical protein
VWNRAVVPVPLNSGFFLGSSSVPGPYSMIPVPAIEPVPLQTWCGTSVSLFDELTKRIARKNT